jgi:hypothetical protein
MTLVLWIAGLLALLGAGVAVLFGQEGYAWVARALATIGGVCWGIAAVRQIVWLITLGAP